MEEGAGRGEGALRESPSGACGGACLFNASVSAAVYTSAMLLRTGNSTEFADLTLATSSWLNAPVGSEMYSWATGEVRNVPPPSLPSRTVAPQSQAAHARHIDTTEYSDVMMVTGSFFTNEDTGAKSCYVQAFGGDGNTTAHWVYELDACETELDGSKPLIAISDDGSTVGFLVAVNKSGVGVSSAVETGIQLHVLDGGSGKVLFIHSPPESDATFLNPRSVSISRDGDDIAYVNNNTVYLLHRDGTLYDQHTMPTSSAARICPMGRYLVFGWNEAQVFEKNSTSGKFAWHFTAQPANPGSILFSTTIAVNGGGGAKYGCFLSLGWTDGMQASVDLYSLVYGTHFWTWRSVLNHNSAIDNAPVAMASHLNFFAVALWGNANETTNPSPQILLFDVSSNKPVLTYITPGSMLNVDMLVTSTSSSSDGQDDTGATVLVAASGKHVHANELGRGGDFFVLKHTPSPTSSSSQMKSDR